MVSIYNSNFSSVSTTVPPQWTVSTAGGGTGGKVDLLANDNLEFVIPNVGGYTAAARAILAIPGTRLSDAKSVWSITMSGTSATTPNVSEQYFSVYHRGSNDWIPGGSFAQPLRGVGASYGSAGGLVLQYFVAGSKTNITNVTVPLPASRQVYLAVQTIGTTVRAKVWDAALGIEGEPGTWNVTGTQTAVPEAGRIQVVHAGGADAANKYVLLESVQVFNKLRDPGTSANLLDDNTAGIETSSVGWIAGTNCSKVRVQDANARTGTASLQVTATAVGARTFSMTDPYVPVTDTSVPFTLSAWAKMNTNSRTLTIQASWYNSAGTFISTTSLNTVTLNAAYQWLTGTVYPPAGAARLYMAFSWGAGAVGDVMYMDDATIHNPVYFENFRNNTLGEWTAKSAPSADNLVTNNSIHIYRPENTTTDASGAHIKTEKVGTQWYSDLIDTRYGIAFGYSVRVEARLRLPFGKGLWPTIWMMPQPENFGSQTGAYGPWPSSGEIDIMESISDGFSYGTIHGDDPLSSGFANHWSQPPFPNRTAVDVTQFHVYSIEFTTTRFTWYIDGRSYQSSNLGPNQPQPFDKPFYLIINTAVGGDWPGNPDATTPLTSFLDIDWVRVASMDPSITPPPSSGTALYKYRQANGWTSVQKEYIRKAGVWVLLA